MAYRIVSRIPLSASLLLGSRNEKSRVHVVEICLGESSLESLMPVFMPVFGVFILQYFTADVGKNYL